MIHAGQLVRRAVSISHDPALWREGGREGRVGVGMVGRGREGGVRDCGGVGGREA